jgi:hypothetical protein
MFKKFVDFCVIIYFGKKSKSLNLNLFFLFTNFIYHGNTTLAHSEVLIPCLNINKRWI